MLIVYRNALIALLLVVGFPAAYPAEWKIDPTLRFRAGYNDNVRLTTDNEVSSAEATFSPSAIFSVATPTSGASGTVRFDFRRFEADSNLDDNNSRLQVNAFHSMERSRLGLDLGFIKDTTLDSQLEATGLIFDRIRRQTINASPNWTWFYGERTQLGANYTYTDVQYKNPGDTGFVNYNLNAGQLSLTRKINERATASVTLSGAQSDNDNDVKSTNTNLQGGASYQFSETLSGSLFAGVRRTQVDYSQTSFIPIFSGGIVIGFEPLTQDVSNSDFGYTFSGSLTKKFLRGETTVSASRNISNEINGTPIEVTRVRWLNLYRFSETLSGNLNLEFYNSQTSNTAGQSLDRNYYQVSPQLTWKFRQFWNLTGSYDYKKQIFDNTSDDAIRNAAYLTLTYQWPRIAVSR